jgi:hypothetical protein
MGSYSFEFDLSNSVYLREQRGIGFEEIITLIEAGNLLAVLPHPRPDKYPGQELYCIDIDGYVWIAPYIRKGDAIRLITCYPSRKETKKWPAGKKG